MDAYSVALIYHDLFIHSPLMDTSVVSSFRLFWMKWALPLLPTMMVALWFLKPFFNVVVFFIKEWEHEENRGARGERERERIWEWENLKQAPWSAWSPMRGLVPWPWDHDLSWNQPSEPPRRPWFLKLFSELRLNICLRASLFRTPSLAI